MKKLLMLPVVAGVSLGFLMMFAPILLTSYQLASMEQASREAYPEIETSTKMTRLQDFKALTQLSESRLGISSAQPYDFTNLALMVLFSLLSAFTASFAFKRRVVG